MFRFFDALCPSLLLFGDVKTSTFLVVKYLTVIYLMLFWQRKLAFCFFKQKVYIVFTCISICLIVFWRNVSLL